MTDRFVPTTNSNAFLLTIIDEFSRFPFAFPCKDTSAATFIECLTTLFFFVQLLAYHRSSTVTEALRSSVQSTKAFLIHVEWHTVALRRITHQEMVK